jgi:hypothetical protein
MERRFEARLDEMMGQAEVSPELLERLKGQASVERTRHCALDSSEYNVRKG